MAAVAEEWRAYYDLTPVGTPASVGAIARWNLLGPQWQNYFVNWRRQFVADSAQIANDRNTVHQLNTFATLNVINAAIPRNWRTWIRTANEGLRRREPLLIELDRLRRGIADFLNGVNGPAHVGGPPWPPIIRAQANVELNAANVESAVVQHNIVALEGAVYHPPVPTDPATGAQKVPLSYLPREYLRRRNRFKNANPLPAEVRQPQNIWQGAWMIGQGAMSNTGLWVRHSGANHTVKDRVFVKQVSTRDSWTDAIYWEGNVLDPNTRTPTEVACQRAMAGIGNRTTTEKMVPDVRHWIMDNALKEFMIYTGYCSLGNLDDLVGDYVNNGGRYPEPFLWYCFQALSEACLAMEKGHQDATAGQVPTPGWEQIVHRDIKLANVFLDDPSGRWFPRYPAPKLGDYGLAIRTTPNDPLNPSGFTSGAGTHGFLAPETREYIDLNHPNHAPTAQFPLLAKTNVWGIGQIMFCLISYVQQPVQVDYMGDGTDNNTRPHVANHNPANYSATLVDLVQRCLEFNPANRPSPRQLIVAIDNAIDWRGVDGGGLALGLQAPMGFSTAHHRNNPVNEVRKPVDAYRKGLAQGGLPPR